jgi:predicted AAA+ superfamily ATPase
MNKETLKQVLWQFQERPWPTCRRRMLEVPVDSGKVVCLTGARRTGKTFLLFQTMNDLLANGVEREHIIYLNFEDDRLYPVKLDDLDLILRAHLELFPETAENCHRYIFFDEIQNVPEWERYVRRIYDTENVSIFLTGSSSSLLRRDMSTAMRGRSIAYEIFPLSFAEYLSFREIEYTPYSTESEARVIHAFQEYLDWGGFPEIVEAEESIKPLILQEYVNLMLYRDLIERYSIRNEHGIRLLLKFCAQHTGSLISINKLYNDLKSQGVKLGKGTLYEYMHMLEDAYIAFSCSKYDPSTRRQMQAAQKIHMLDPGLVRAYQTRLDKDIGHRFESLVFLHQRRQTNTNPICYYRNGFELDMCWNDGENFINVAWDMTDTETVKRETKALDQGLQLWPESQAKLVYGIGTPPPSPHDQYAVEGWKYFLGG